MNLFEFSVIIPTFNREKQLINILKNLKSQLNNKYKIEIIICDSYSDYNKKIFPKQKYNFKIKYININENILAKKRNFGIKLSKYKYIILLDDDCIPDRNFLKEYHKSFIEIKPNSILSGIVDYPIKYLKKSNYIKYRNSKHFKYTDHKNYYNNYLPANKIVAMNMGFINSSAMKKLGYFNEKFIGYGFEDFEFGYRYNKFGYKLIKTRARIIHDEGAPNLEKYLNKFFHLGRDGMKNLILINKNSAKKTTYNKLENNLIFKIITKMPKLEFLLLNIEKILLVFEKFQNIYLPYLYDFLRTLSYTRGFLNRDKKKLKPNNRDWYE